MLYTRRNSQLDHHLGGHRFQPPDLCIVSQAEMALWRNRRLMTGLPPPRSGLVSTSTHWAWAVAMSFANRQTFPSMSFISQPTPSFGAWRSTSGLSLFGMAQYGTAQSALTAL
jgi:hypothetical protein